MGERDSPAHPHRQLTRQVPVPVRNYTQNLLLVYLGGNDAWDRGLEPNLVCAGAVRQSIYPRVSSAHRQRTLTELSIHLARGAALSPDPTAAPAPRHTDTNCVSRNLTDLRRVRVDLWAPCSPVAHATHIPFQCILYFWSCHKASVCCCWPGRVRGLG